MRLPACWKSFGAVPNRVRERVSSADLATLDTWLNRAIDASDLQSVFGSTWGSLHATSPHWLCALHLHRVTPAAAQPHSATR
jgi:hypothetical protein